ncbi:hypothetical protein E3E38_04885 [Thermococcus sp. 18S1]|uniref:hypothetical protein n=1 Tax=Thermococcus sp. 18S1 TaxID=1638210 RepID=UPI00143BD202|nr:hypothetical protein [Thermococcus sp. 18S1]NJE30387.1 hypothetical protein [Thermococcus sp. 18S1]
MRRAQLFSFDAMLALVLVIFILGTVNSTSSTLQNEITTMLGWYERANIADNVLDIMTKSPGEPANWATNPSNTEVIGLRENNSLYSLDYYKLEALSNYKEILKTIIAKMANYRDVLLEGYLSEFQIGITGDFPTVYLYNKTFENPNDNPPGINFMMAGDSKGNTIFTVTYVEIQRNGVTYVDDSICDLKKGNNLDLMEGDHIKFVTGQVVYIEAKRGKYVENYIIPADSTIEIYITGPETSNFKLNFGGGECPYSFKFTGKGNVVLTVTAYDNSRPEIWAKYTTYDELIEKKEATYRFAVINGAIVVEPDEIDDSKKRSPWTEVAERISIVGRIQYDLSGGPSDRNPLIYGRLKYQVPESGSFTVSAPESAGSIEFVIISGSQLTGLKIYRNEQDGKLNAVVVYQGNKQIKRYSGDSSVSIPLKDLCSGSEGEVIGLWMYSISRWDRSSVQISITPNLEPFLAPKFDSILLRAEVWDDLGGENQ